MKTSIEQTATIEIAPEVGARISAVLSTYNDLKAQADLLYEQMEIEKEKIYTIMKDAGISKAKVDGVPLTEIKSSQSVLDKVKFVALGGSLEMLENATFSKPKKAYLQIGEDAETKAAKKAAKKAA